MSDTLSAKSSQMLRVAEAQAIVRQQFVRRCRRSRWRSPRPPRTRCSASRSSAISTCRPIDKSMMDGYAVRSADLPDGQGDARSHRGNHRRQGAARTRRRRAGQPHHDRGADSRRGRCRGHGRTDARWRRRRVEIEDRPPKPGQNILPRGAEMQRGDKVLPAGTRAAAAGVRRPRHGRPHHRLGASGAARRRPVHRRRDGRAGPAAGGRDRSATATARCSSPRSAGPAACRATSASPAIDRDCLRPLICEGCKSRRAAAVGRRLGRQARPGAGRAARGRRAAALSQGRDEARQAGVLRQPRGGGSRRWCSACPATGQRLVCFELFVRPALRRLRGHADPGPHFVSAVLSEDFAYRTDRPTYHPAGWS